MGNELDSPTLVEISPLPARRKFLLFTGAVAAEAVLLACGQASNTRVSPTVRPNATPLASVRIESDILPGFDTYKVAGGIMGIKLEKPDSYDAGKFAHYLDANVLNSPQPPAGVLLHWPEKEAKIEIASYLRLRNAGEVILEGKLLRLDKPNLPKRFSGVTPLDTSRPIQVVWSFRNGSYISIEINGITSPIKVD